jgi:GNAT superfamily N-acetyltransferase
MELILADPKRELVVGTLDGMVVGYGVGRTEDLGGDEVLGRVEALYVDPPARGVGVGEVVLARLLDWFAGQGCTGVDALALPGDRDTKSFFEAAGFKTRLLVMHRPL